MVKYVLIRDDDTNFFTIPRMLEEIYEEIFEMGIPVNLSVIPFVSTETKTYYPWTNKKLRYEPFIPKEFENRNLCIPFYENLELTESLANMHEFIEIVQHGFSHSQNEFSSSNEVELREKILNGKKILEKSFGSTPKFFSAPYDAYSSNAFSLLKKHFQGATLGEFKLSNKLNVKHLPLALMPHYFNALRKGEVFFINNNFLLLGHNGFLIDPFVDIDKTKESLKASAIKNHRVMVLMQHYWNYFYSREECQVKDKLNKSLHNTFIDIVQWLKAEGARFVTISHLHKILVG